MRSSLYSLAKRFARDERGASLVEYAVLVGLITVGLVGVIGLLSGAIVTEFNDVITALGTATN